MKRPNYFTARKNGEVYSARVETIFCKNSIPFGTVESDIPEQPRNMRELVDLRQSGYTIESLKDIRHA